jgi:hypothetical protein
MISHLSGKWNRRHKVEQGKEMGYPQGLTGFFPKQNQVDKSFCRLPYSKWRSN